MLHALDMHRGHGSTGQGRQQDAAQGVAQRMAKATLQRFDDELAVLAVVANFDTFDLCLFDFYGQFLNPPCSGLQ